MRSRPGQGAREAPRGQRGGPRQPWPLILLGLAVGTHGLLPPTAAPRNTAPSMEAPAGKSPWSLWDSEKGKPAGEKGPEQTVALLTALTLGLVCLCVGFYFLILH
ncbi:hypothetical protein FD755_018063 [Muntiacus reevesi]|uniref:Uncharacterized protein n=1 Tax=Muntiacus reevesi TaxID=9886 RepID=A0A5N3X7M1_MUNRE|nr:hypothetical protein FD755_018063 [Muntiacus reevesi]